MKRLILMLLLALALLTPALAEEQLTLSAGKEPLRGFQENVLTADCPAAGTLTVTVADEVNVYRVLTQAVEAGENAVIWDGLGDHLERLPEGAYTLQAALTATDGRAYDAALPITLQRCRQALLFALPSGETLYRGGEWYVEFKLVREGRLVTEIYRAEDMAAPLETRRRSITGYRINQYAWDGRVDGEYVPEGNYVLRFYAEETPEYAVDVPVRVRTEEAPELPVAVTGAIMPEEGADDAAIWRLMTAPATVVDIKPVAHQEVRAEPSAKAKSLGTLHGTTQAVEVLEVREDGWCRVGAWNHEDGSYMEGYVPTAKLRVVQPQTRYGLLLDKRAQTLTLFEEGRRVGEMRVSTGLVAKGKLIQETAAGSFLMGEHMADFSNAGYNYDYVIRYDGGNLLHQAGWRRKGGKQDFSIQLSTLGQKASHGCVRMEPCTGDGELTAYWMFTHIPAGTRLIILDDPAQRVTQAAEAAAGTAADRVLTEMASPTDLAAGETELTITLGGDVVLGTREKWQAEEIALPAVLAREGYGYPFRNLLPIFQADDMTLVNLECVLKADGRGEDKDKLYRFRGLPEYTKVLRAASIEQVNIANNHHIDYGKDGRASTVEALTAANIPSSGYGSLYIWEKDGHRIGFGGCRETTWRQDRDTIAREVEKLRSLGCEVVIYSCHWGTEYSPTHDSKLQLAMAQSAVDAGVDIVVGTHPHVVQGIEYRDGTLILYSLGNLMFGGTHDMTTFDAMLAQVRLRFGAQGYEGAALSLLPVLTSGSAPFNDFCPVLAEGEDALRILAKVQADSDIALRDAMFFPARKAQTDGEQLGPVKE